MARFREILIIRLSAIGDVVNCLPALRLLKREYPQSRITWAAEQPSASLLQGDPDIDEVFVVRRKEWTTGLVSPANIVSMGQGFQYLRRKNFDVSVDFQGNLRSGVVTMAGGARVRIGFTPGRVKEHSHVFYTKKVSLPRNNMHRIHKNLRLLEALGIKPELLPANLNVTRDDAGSITRFIEGNDLSERKIVSIHPGVSKFGAFKQWAPEKFVQVAAQLGKKKGRAVIVTWGPGERALAQEVAKLSGGSAILGPEPRGLRELAYLLKQSSLFVGCDTGPLYIAAAVGTPVVAIFGPKDPEIYGPVGDGHLVVRRQIECSPCKRRTCPDPRCMKVITAEEVKSACEKILG